MADPALFNPLTNGNLADDLYFQTADFTKGKPEGQLGLILMQLKIITLLLRTGFNITDEDLTLNAQYPQTLNPPLTPSI